MDPRKLIFIAATIAIVFENVDADIAETCMDQLQRHGGYIGNETHIEAFEYAFDSIVVPDDRNDPENDKAYFYAYHDHLYNIAKHAITQQTCKGPREWCIDLFSDFNFEDALSLLNAEFGRYIGDENLLEELNNALWHMGYFNIDEAKNILKEELRMHIGHQTIEFVFENTLSGLMRTGNFNVDEAKCIIVEDIGQYIRDRNIVEVLNNELRNMNDFNVEETKNILKQDIGQNIGDEIIEVVFEHVMRNMTDMEYQNMVTYERCIRQLFEAGYNNDFVNALKLSFYNLTSDSLSEVCPQDYFNYIRGSIKLLIRRAEGPNEFCNTTGPLPSRNPAGQNADGQQSSSCNGIH